jgi:hypothetical protein
MADIPVNTKYQHIPASGSWMRSDIDHEDSKLNLGLFSLWLNVVKAESRRKVWGKAAGLLHLQI